MPITALLLFLSLSLLLVACRNSSVETEGLKPVPPSSMFVEHLTPFCGTSAPDKFTAGYYGSSPLDTTIYFYIVCHKGDTVYRDQWPGASMLPADTQGNDSIKIAHVHDALHQLVEGKLAPTDDSLAASVPETQRRFRYAIGTQPAVLVYYTAQGLQVHKQ
jgi:hypothetical protein